MSEERPIDRKRNAGGQTDIGTEEDGAIEEMINLEDRLIIVKTRSIYEMQMADAIDPQRTNINLPTSVHKLLINQGTESEIVGKTFLTARTLFHKGHLDQSINTKVLLKLSIEISNELIVLNREIAKYLDEEKKLHEGYDNAKAKPGSYSIPSVLNLETECKTIFQKADHVEQILMEIVTIFYPAEGLTKQSHFPKLLDLMKKKYGEADAFVKFLSEIEEFMKVIRDLRNGLDHRLSFVTVWNFELQVDSSVFSPSIELKSKEAKLERTSLSHFLPLVLENLVTITETMFAYLASKNAKQSAMSFQVKEIPEERRRYKHVSFSFWSPIGQGGFFDQ